MKYFPKTQEKYQVSTLCYKMLSLLSSKIIIINYISIKWNLVPLCDTVGGKNAKWHTDKFKDSLCSDSFHI